MKERERVLLLVGSAKRPKSTSESLGTYLLERLEGQGFETEMLLLHRALRSEAGQAELLAATDRADLLVLAFPLYVDTLPHLAIKALELIAEHRQAEKPSQGQRMLAIANCGFPEAAHNDTALTICRQFAHEAGFDWAGALSLGGGQTIDGRALAQVQGMARNVIRALDLAADALARGEPVPSDAEGFMSKSIVPAWAYIWMGGIGWKRQARKHGMQKMLRARPYQ